MKIRNIIVFMIVFLMSTFMNVSTIHAESDSRKGSVQIVYKGRNELNQEVNLSNAKFSIYQVQYMSNDTLTWKDNFKDSHISLEDISAEAREKQAKQLYEYAQKKDISCLTQIIYIFLTIFLYLLKCPQSLILSALRAFCFCGKPHISRSIFLYFRYQAWLKSW